jgi:hypothetical protein
METHCTCISTIFPPNMFSGLSIVAGHANKNIISSYIICMYSLVFSTIATYWGPGCQGDFVPSGRFPNFNPNSKHIKAIGVLDPHGLHNRILDSKGFSQNIVKDLKKFSAFYFFSFKESSGWKERKLRRVFLCPKSLFEDIGIEENCFLSVQKKKIPMHKVSSFAEQGPGVSKFQH